MTVNFSARKSTIIIVRADNSTFNATNNFISYSGSDNKTDTSGTITHNGQIELGINYSDLSVSLDDRINPLTWARGNKIIIDVTDDAGVLVRHPRGSLRILQSTYSPMTRRLTLQVGDIFSLLDFRSPEDDESGIELGSGITRTAIINSLLTAAGAPSISSGSTDLINYPLPKFVGSYVQQAGEVAIAAGYFLWVDNFEQIRCDRIDLLPTTILYSYTLTQDVARYERLEGSEKPCEIVACRGTDLLLQQIPLGYTTLDETFSTKGQLFPHLFPASLERILESRIATTINWNPFTRTETITKTFEQPKAAATGAVGGGYLLGSTIAIIKWKTEVTIRKFDTFGRLSTILTTDTRPPGNWIGAAMFGTDQTPVLGDKSEVIYTYSSKGIISKIERTEYQLLSTLYQGFLTTNYTSTGNVSFRLAPSTSTVEEWKEIRKGTWEYRITELVAKAALETRTGGAVSETTSFITKSQNTQISSSGQTTPPATEYHQPTHSSENNQLVGEARFNVVNNPYKPRRRDYNVQYATSIAQLTALAKTLGGFLFGRDKGQQIDLELSDEILTNYKPLARIDVNEGAITQSYLIDGCSWVLTPNRALVSTDGIWTGTVNNEGIVAPPYSAIALMSGGIRIGGSLRSIPQSLLPTYGSLRGGVRVGGRLKSTPITNMRGGIRVGGILTQSVASNVTPMRGGIRVGGQIIARSSYSAVVLADNPVRYYRLGESSGTTATDSSQSNSNGTYTQVTLGATSLITNDSNTAVAFNGTSSTLTFTNSITTLSALSLECWVDLSSASLRGCFIHLGFNNLTSGNGVAIGVGASTHDNLGNKLIAVAGGVAWVNSNINIGTGRHHIGLAVRANGVFLIYLDGALVFTSGATGRTAASSDAHVGSANAVRFVNAIIDEVAIYNYELVAAQWLAHFNAGL